MVHQIPPLHDKSLLIERCFIEGEWTPAASHEVFEVRDPATGKTIACCPDCDVVDVERAVAAAETAIESFRNTTARYRAKLLRRWHDLVVENAEDLATLITWESGKPFADAKGEVNYSASFLEWFSEEATRAYGDTFQSTASGQRAMTVRQPVGVCGLITPWNFPAAMVARKAAPAIAAGCTIVLKTPGETPLTGNALVELARRAGIPAAVLNVVTAMKNTPSVGKALTESPIIRKISFTGSTNVGKLLMAQSSPTLKKLSMELGGNAPFIVFDDCINLDDAVLGCIAAKFRSNGQTCVCANRIYVQSGVYKEFAKRLTKQVAKFKVGHGFDKGVTHGPLIYPRAVDKIERQIKDAITKGAKVTAGGARAPEHGECFFQPTVMTGVTADMEVATSETFGPLAALFEFTSEDDVVRQANCSNVGLAAYVFSQSVERVFRVADRLEVGMVGINTGLISDVATPFGGVKESGFGREGSKYGMDEYLVMKTITIGQPKL